MKHDQDKKAELQSAPTTGDHEVESTELTGLVVSTVPAAGELDEAALEMVAGGNLINAASNAIATGLGNVGVTPEQVSSVVGWIATGGQGAIYAAINLSASISETVQNGRRRR